MKLKAKNIQKQIIMVRNTDKRVKTMSVAEARKQNIQKYARG